jgi:hypothetical protein
LVRGARVARVEMEQLRVMVLAVVVEQVAILPLAD